MRFLSAMILLVFSYAQPVIAQQPGRLKSSIVRLSVASVVLPASTDTQVLRLTLRTFDPEPRLDQRSNSGATSGERGWIARHPALFGALLGASAGALTGYALGQDCSQNAGTGSCSSKGGASVVGAGLGGAGGALVGFLVGRK